METADLIPLPDGLPEKAENPSNKPDKLDKYRDHLLNQAPLSSKQQEMLERYRKAFAWRSRLFSPQQVVQMLMEEYRIRFSQAYAIADESERLFGSTKEGSKKALIQILTENLYVAMAIAQRNEDAAAIISAVDKIAKLHRAYEDVAPVNVDDMMPARTVKYVQQNVTINNNNFGEGGNNG